MSTLDPRNALVIDTHELGRRAGAMLAKSLTVTAPADLGTDVIGIPEGADLRLELRLESVIEGVLVTGEVSAEAKGECARCLIEIAEPLTVDFQELYEYPDSDNASDDEDTLRIEGDLLDLEPAVRDALVLQLPLAPLCSETCLGLCSECGTDLNKDPKHHHDIVDARWQSLQGLLPDLDPKEG